jgi:tetratricopeptide (TPR) repeat protein
VLGRGWKKADRARRAHFRWFYVRALYKAGQLGKAFDEVGPRKETFEQLAGFLTEDGKGAELKQLVAAQRKQAGEQAYLLVHEARAELLLKRPERALELFVQAYRQEDERQRRRFVYPFVRAMAEAGQALPVYRAIPDRMATFSTVAGILRQQKNTRDLVQLLQEHAQHQPDDPNRFFQAGELYLLRGDVSKAEQCFALALRKVDPQRQWMYRNGLFRARVMAGKTVQTYKESAPDQTTFSDLAHACSGSGNVGELEALLAAHRERDPDDVDLPAWEVEVLWLKKDHEGVCKRLTEQRTALLASPRWRWKFEGYLVRALVRSKKTEQAVKEAEALARKNRGDPLLRVLAHAANGDVKRTIAEFARLGDRHERQRCYQDEDLGPLLRSEAFAALRQRFPEAQKER